MEPSCTSEVVRDVIDDVIEKTLCVFSSVVRIGVHNCRAMYVASEIDEIIEKAVAFDAERHSRSRIITSLSMLSVSYL